MTEEQNNKNNNQKQQLSKELLNYLIELKTTISKLKEIYQTIDKKAQEEGFSSDDIYDIANAITDDVTLRSIVTMPDNNKQTTTTKNTTINNNNNILYSYFQ